MEILHHNLVIKLWIVASVGAKIRNPRRLNCDTKILAESEPNVRTNCATGLIRTKFQFSCTKNTHLKKIPRFDPQNACDQ